MKLQLLPSTFEDGTASPRQHLTCFVIDDAVAIDAGSLAMAATERQRRQVRDIVLTHAHLDHFAGLPLFIDDLFSVLEEPVTVHATEEVVETLKNHVFNWSVYPDFSELANSTGAVLIYRIFRPDEEFMAGHLTFEAIEVNHKVPTTGFIVSNDSASIAITGDTAATDDFWKKACSVSNLSAVLVECAFPDELSELAERSYHLTPRLLKRELEKFPVEKPVYVINMKPAYRDRIIQQIEELKIRDLRILTVGKEYEF